jgi:hypothetical protein
MSYKLQIQLKDEKYPYFEDKVLDITNIGFRTKGRLIYISGRFVQNGENGEKYVEFERISPIALKLVNAKITQTEKGTLIIKYEPNAVLYVIEIPSGYRGDVETQVSGECIKTVVLRSPAGSLGYVDHIWCNGNAEIQYKISGKTRTAGYGRLIDYFGETLSGKIIVKDGRVEIIYDEQLDQLLS